MTNQRPTVYVNITRKAIGGTVHVLKPERVELIDGDIHQECSLEDSWKARHESWPVDIFVLNVKHDFSEIHTLCRHP